MKKRSLLLSVITLASLGFIQNALAMNPNRELFAAARSGNIAQAQQALKDGANIKAQNPGGFTPLYQAVRSRDKDMVQFLLGNGAQESINQPNSLGLTPLFEAVRSGNKDIIKLLLQNDANVNAQNHHYGTTPLYEAVQSRNRDMVQLLLAHDAQESINTPNNDGDTPLHEAVRSGNKDIVQLLLVHGAQINTPNEAGETPLHEAVLFRDIAIANLLILALNNEQWQQFNNQYSELIEKIRDKYRNMAKQWNYMYRQARQIPAAYHPGAPKRPLEPRVSRMIADAAVPDLNETVAQRLGFRFGKPQIPQQVSSAATASSSQR